MKPRLKQILSELNQISNIPLKNFEQRTNLGGGNNELYFGTFPEFKIQKQNVAERDAKNNQIQSSAGLNAVFYRSKDLTDSITAEEHGNFAEAERLRLYMAEKNMQFQAAQELIQRKKVRTTFIQTYIYHKKNERIALQADSDLYQYASRARSINKQTLKKMVAQIVLSVAELHRNQLVHRDLKCKNFLVTHRNGDTHIQLADLDDLAEVNDNNRPSISSLFIAISDSHSAPEVLVCWPSRERRNNQELYISLDLKAADCYSLGKTLHELTKIASIEGRISTDLSTMISQLTIKDPNTRFTIEQVLANPFFGATPQEREKYFSDVESAFQQDLYIDTFYVSPYLSMEDAFTILPPSIKHIYFLSESVDVQLAHCIQYQITDLQTAFTAIAILESTQRNTFALIELINIALLQKELKIFHRFLFSIKEEILRTISLGIHQIHEAMNLFSHYLPSSVIPTTVEKNDGQKSVVENYQNDNEIEHAVNNILSTLLSVEKLVISALNFPDLNQHHLSLNELSSVIKRAIHDVKLFNDSKKDNILTGNTLFILKLFSTPAPMEEKNHHCRIQTFFSPTITPQSENVPVVAKKEPEHEIDYVNLQPHNTKLFRGESRSKATSGTHSSNGRKKTTCAMM